VSPRIARLQLQAFALTAELATRVNPFLSFLL
jgi:hypothetical protein